MSKLLSLLIAAVFAAVSFTAVAAEDTMAPAAPAKVEKKETKMEAKKVHKVKKVHKAKKVHTAKKEKMAEKKADAAAK